MDEAEIVSAVLSNRVARRRAFLSSLKQRSTMLPRAWMALMRAGYRVFGTSRQAKPGETRPGLMLDTAVDIHVLQSRAPPEPDSNHVRLA